MERLYARQQKTTGTASKQGTGTAETTGSQRERSEDGHPQTLGSIPEESNGITEQTRLSNDTGDKSSAVRVPEEAGSYFALREDKDSPALSIVELLGSDSDSDSSEEGDADVDSESDSDNNPSST
jgi:hypothetical protein